VAVDVGGVVGVEVGGGMVVASGDGVTSWAPAVEAGVSGCPLQADTIPANIALTMTSAR